MIITIITVTLIINLYLAMMIINNTEFTWYTEREELDYKHQALVREIQWAVNIGMPSDELVQEIVDEWLYEKEQEQEDTWEEDTEEYAYQDQDGWDEAKEGFYEGWEKGARIRERVLGNVRGVVESLNEQLLEAEQAAQAACAQYVHEVAGVYHDVRDYVQQVVWYYQASKAKDITPTKVVRVRPTVGGVHAPVLLPACYEQQVD